MLHFASSTSSCSCISAHSILRINLPETASSPLGCSREPGRHRGKCNEAQRKFARGKTAWKSELIYLAGAEFANSRLGACDPSPFQMPITSPPPFRAGTPPRRLCRPGSLPWATKMRCGRHPRPASQQPSPTNK